jgi:hypothetical protein
MLQGRFVLPRRTRSALAGGDVEVRVGSKRPTSYAKVTGRARLAHCAAALGTTSTAAQSLAFLVKLSHCAFARVELALWTHRAAS